MIGRLEVVLRRWRRAASRSEWLATLLGLSRSVGTATEAGLVLVQVDGLSHTQLTRALARGEMPFLRHLLECEHYRLHRQYSGLPSSTGAVQAELFYGLRQAVPAFSFLDGASGKVMRLIEPTPVARLERNLAQQGGPSLLEGGSAYVNIFTGGAAESHFCPASLGWGPGLRGTKAWILALLLVSHAYSFLRVGVLLLLELWLAILDCVRGLIQGENIVAELTFVPTRVAISILLRELATIGAKIDIARGLPIVHLNLVGYDEQAHRRGPDSAFAHWTLKGIDDAIARLWRASHRSARRSYELWIYGDHGQAEAVSYDEHFGRSLADAVAEVFSALEGAGGPVTSAEARGEQTYRARWLGGKRIQRLLPVQRAMPMAAAPAAPVVVAPGPVGLLYAGRALSDAERAALAKELVNRARVPLVLEATRPGEARAWTDQGEFTLPAQAAQILGIDHPYAAEVANDLATLCHHPDAGDFVLCGWRAGTPCYTFAAEHGAHGGASPEETSTFALLPADAPLPAIPRGYLRPADLRHAALTLLGRVKDGATPKAKPRPRQDTLRIMTYNVHSCIGMDGKLSPERIARIIARYSPDVVALQELDVGRARTEGLDQAHLIARLLAMDFHFHPAMHLEEERYGDAILTHLPMRLVKAAALPGPPRLEPRGALWTAIDLQGSELHLINTHLGLLGNERLLQIEALLGPDWLGHPDCTSPVVLCGDLNALPSSRACRRLSTRLNDAQAALEGRRPKQTFFGRFPTARIDHIFADPSIEVRDIEVPDTELTRVASDHLPLIVELRVPCADRQGAPAFTAASRLG